MHSGAHGAAEGVAGGRAGGGAVGGRAVGGVVDGAVVDGAVGGAGPVRGASGAAVRLWLLPEEAVGRLSARLGGRTLLTTDERQRLHRLRGAGARRRFIGARLLVRQALSDSTGLPYDQWWFTRTPHGRPEPGPRTGGVRVSLSHTEGLIACVVTRQHACGVDAERTPASPGAVAYLPRHFAAAEQADIAAAPDGRGRAERVAAYWVLKEAYLKACGIGLRRGLGTFAFTPPDRPPVRVTDPLARPAQPWHLEIVRPPTGHVVAVAVAGTCRGPVPRTVLTG
jgi:4'-phosphopantetheinyl transferase